MDRDQVLKQYIEIINRISKFEELVNFLNIGLGDVIYEDLKRTNHEFLNILNGLGVVSPRETFYVWQQFYNYLTEKEHANIDRIECGKLLNFFIQFNSNQNILYRQNR